MAKKKLLQSRNSRCGDAVLSRLRQALRAPLDRILRGRPIDDALFDDLEEVLLGADVGVQETLLLIERLRERCQRERPADGEELKGYLKDEMLRLLPTTAPPAAWPSPALGDPDGRCQWSG